MNPSVGQTLKDQFLSFKSTLIIFLISFFYFSFSVLFLNYKLVLLTVFSDNPIPFKLTVVYQLVTGSYRAFQRMDFYSLVLISILVGLNTFITAKIIRNLKNQGGRLSLVFGGSTVLGILSIGCSSCGFSIISLLGLTSALSIIPLGQFGLSLTVIILLTLSLIYSVKTYHNKIVCGIRS